MVSSAYLRLLIFLPAILIPVCDSSTPEFHVASGPITSQQIDRETMETMTDFIFLGSKITVDSVTLFSSCPQSFPASGSFQMSHFFASGSQSIGASASASALPMNIQDLFPLGWTAWISLLSKELSRVFSGITNWKLQFFGIQPSLWSNSHIHIWLLEKP